jgi:dolichol kinase
MMERAMALVLVPAVALAARAPVVAAVAAVASGVDVLASRRRRLAGPLQALLAAAALAWGGAAYADLRDPAVLVDASLLLLAVGCVPAAYAAQRRWPELRWGACERLVLLQAVAASVALWARCAALDLLVGLDVRSAPAAPRAAQLDDDVTCAVTTLMGGCGAVVLMTWRLLRAHAKPAGEVAMATAPVVVHAGDGGVDRYYRHGNGGTGTCAAANDAAASTSLAAPSPLVVLPPVSPRRARAGLDSSALVRRSPRLATTARGAPFGGSASDGEEGAAARPHTGNATSTDSGVGHRRGAAATSASAYPACADARTAALFYGCVAAVVACLEYPLLWAHLRQEPVRWVVGTFFYALDDSSTTGNSGSRWGGASGAVHAPALAAWWLALLGGLLAFAPRHDEDDAGSAGGSSGGGSSSSRARRAGAAASSALRRVRLFPRGRWNLLLRKLFHAAAVAMFAPPLVLDYHAHYRHGSDAHALRRPHALFLALALAVAVKGMVLLELARALALPPAALSAAVQRYVSRYTDRRDAGVFVVTHLLLLVGCALPLWLSVLGGDGGGALPPPLPLALPLAGVLSLGVGDAAAAVAGITAVTLRVGHRWGDLVAAARARWRRCISCCDARSPRSPQREPPPQQPPAAWPGARKTVEGTVAFVAATAAVMALLQAAADARGGEAPPIAQPQPPLLLLSRGWAAFLAATAAAAGVETFTATLDNLTLPLVAWLGLGALEWVR